MSILSATANSALVTVGDIYDVMVFITPVRTDGNYLEWPDSMTQNLSRQRQIISEVENLSIDLITRRCRWAPLKRILNKYGKYDDWKYTMNGRWVTEDSLQRGDRIALAYAVKNDRIGRSFPELKYIVTLRLNKKKKYVYPF